MTELEKLQQKNDILKNNLIIIFDLYSNIISNCVKKN